MILATLVALAASCNMCQHAPHVSAQIRLVKRERMCIKSLCAKLNNTCRANTWSTVVASDAPTLDYTFTVYANPIDPLTEIRHRLFNVSERIAVEVNGIKRHHRSNRATVSTRLYACTDSLSPFAGYKPDIQAALGPYTVETDRNRIQMDTTTYWYLTLLQITLFVVLGAAAVAALAQVAWKFPKVCDALFG